MTARTPAPPPAAAAVVGDATLVDGGSGSGGSAFATPWPPAAAVPAGPIDPTAQEALAEAHTGSPLASVPASTLPVTSTDPLPPSVPSARYVSAIGADPCRTRIRAWPPCTCTV